MQQFELSEELVSQIEGLIKADNKEDVAKLVEPLHPADIAEIMNELDTKEAQFLFLLLDEEKAGDVLAEIEEDERQRFIDSFPPEVIAKRFVDNMDTDDAADLVGSMPNEQRKKFFHTWKTSNKRETSSICCITTKILPVDLWVKS